MDPILHKLLYTLPTTVSDEQLYFFIWIQEDIICSIVDIPYYYNKKPAMFLIDWLKQEYKYINVTNLSDLLLLRPLSYNSFHFKTY